MLGIFVMIFVIERYFSTLLSKYIFQFYNIRVSNSLDPGQAIRLVGPGLGPNCLYAISRRENSCMFNTLPAGDEFLVGLET